MFNFGNKDLHIQMDGMPGMGGVGSAQPEIPSSSRVTCI